MTAPPKLLGSYSTPRFEYGDVVRCARRGEVRVVGCPTFPSRGRPARRCRGLLRGRPGAAGATTSPA